MNIWALYKDMSIKHLLLMLAEQFQTGSYQIVENPMDDIRSIRLANPVATGTQLYVYTYGQGDGNYGVHVEYADLQETNYSDSIEIYENISFRGLISIMTIILEIPSEK